MEMALISIIRHGETEHNNKKIIQGHLEIPLNKKGREQVKLLAERLSNTHISMILSSDLKRAKQTAEIIKMMHPESPKIAYFDALRERMLGKWEGKPFEEYLLEKKKNNNLEPEGVENTEIFWERINKAKQLIMRMLEEKIKNEKNNAHLVVVSHGGTIRRIITAFLFPQYKEPFPTRIDNASITQIEYLLEPLNYGSVKQNLIIKILNSTCHLEGNITLKEC